MMCTARRGIVGGGASLWENLHGKESIHLKLISINRSRLGFLSFFFFFFFYLFIYLFIFYLKGIVTERGRKQFTPQMAPMAGAGPD